MKICSTDFVFSPITSILTSPFHHPPSRSSSMNVVRCLGVALLAWP